MKQYASGIRHLNKEEAVEKAEDKKLEQQPIEMLKSLRADVRRFFRSEEASALRKIDTIIASLTS